MSCCGRCLGPGCSQCQGVGGHGHRSEDEGEDGIRGPPSQVVGEHGRQGCEDGRSQSTREGDDGKGADVIGCPPAGQCGEGRLVEGGRHGQSCQQPAGEEHWQVGGGGNDEEAGHAEDGTSGHDGARTAVVDHPADSDPGEGGDEQGCGECGCRGAGGPAGVCSDGWVQDGEGVVDDAPAGDLCGAQSGKYGAGPRPVPCSGRGPVGVELGHGQQPPVSTGAGGPASVTGPSQQVLFFCLAIESASALTT